MDALKPSSLLTVDRNELHSGSRHQAGSLVSSDRKLTNLEAGCL
jgi:hypothetical protein